ncbi:MAG: T9SS type A sorting domain-containing protein [Bacteroidota bacterium]|nr:T9SS type A sorting domain-containing protein [Bacteroidota bacterium]
MKTNFLKPGFELIFSISLIAILALPPVLLAQNQKDLEIKIENGDTIINGKNIKELSLRERREALSDIKHLTGEGSDKNTRVYMFQRDSAGDAPGRIGLRRNGFKNGNRFPLITGHVTIRDSLGNSISESRDNLKNMNRAFSFRYRMNNDNPDRMELLGQNFERPLRGPLGFERRNSQNFNYVNTNNDGISTRVSFHVSDASNDDLKRIPLIEGSKFEVENLNLIPEFSSGKTLLMFALPAKTIAEVKLSDSEGRLIWSEKSNGGSFSKKFSLGLNGIYFLQVKQGKNVLVKRILKEE